MGELSLDLSQIQNGQPNDAGPIRTAFTAVQSTVNALDEENLGDGLAETLGVSSTSGVRRGKSIIATQEQQSVIGYKLLATPDRVSGIVLPADGLIAVLYQATWRAYVGGTTYASIFLDESPVQVAYANGGTSNAPIDVEASITFGTGFSTLTTDSRQGLTSNGAGVNYTGDVTTGQMVGSMTNDSGKKPVGGGVCFVFAAAGTYDVSIRFQAGAEVKNRKLWVWTLGF